MTDHAANNIEAHSRSLKEVLKDKHYKVGYFQREYKWTRDNIENLIVDLERSFMSNWSPGHSQADVATYSKYFMGPIVLFFDKVEISIVDGQQRLTSFTLLMIFLNRKLNEVSDTKDKLLNYIYSDYFGVESYNFNIPERVDVLNFLFRGVPFSESVLRNESCENLMMRYGDVEELFPIVLLHPEVLPLFITWITEKLVFIEIKTQTSDSAYTIFETMNDRGLQLTPTEMLKSYLLSKSGDDTKIKALDVIWKNKIGALKAYSNEADQDFFRAWLRAKYAITIRTSERGAVNEDFEKIGTRFHSWVQENDVKQLGLQASEDFYFFVHSDFNFYSDVYLRLLDYEYNEKPDEHNLRLLSYKGISHSLSYPLIMAPLHKMDDEATIIAKIDVVVKFIDAFGAYRLLLNEPITHSAIRNGLYTKTRDIRGATVDELIGRFEAEIKDYRNHFLNDVSYVPYNASHSKYILARLFKQRIKSENFENLYFQRKRDSYVLYQFLRPQDFEPEVQKIPRELKGIFMDSLCSYCIVPKDIIAEIDRMPTPKRILALMRRGYIQEYVNDGEPEVVNDLMLYFMTRNKRLKERIMSLWKV